MKHAFKPLAGLCLAVLFAGPISAQAALPHYNVSAIGGLNSTYTNNPIALNNLGQVVGTSPNGNVTQAYVWQNGTIQHTFDTNVGVEDINDNGWVVGESGSGTGRRGYVWDPVDGLHLLAQQSGEQYSDVTTINNSNVVSGYSSGLIYNQRATIWTSPTTYTSLVGHDVNFSNEVVINEQATVAATYFNFQGNGSGMVYWDTNSDQLQGPVRGNVIDMNDGNDILAYKTSGGAASFIHERDGDERFLALPVSGYMFGAAALNNAQEVVGYCNSCGGDSNRALYWNPTDGVRFIDDLVDLPATGPLSNLRIYDARDINDQGWIIALADDLSTQNVEAIGVLLAPVPEPETYALMLAGLGLVGFAARRRKH